MGLIKIIGTFLCIFKNPLTKILQILIYFKLFRGNNLLNFMT